MSFEMCFRLYYVALLCQKDKANPALLVLTLTTQGLVMCNEKQSQSPRLLPP